jgi:hypothetical protein
LPQEEEKQLRVPELELSVAVRLFKDRYSIFHEPVPDRAYYIRFKKLQRAGEPKLTVQGMTHNKGTMIHPRFLLQILERFDISVPDFLEGLSLMKRGPQSVGERQVS